MKAIQHLFLFLAKGKWVKRDGKNLSDRLYQPLDWEEFELEPLELDWELTDG